MNDTHIKKLRSNAGGVSADEPSLFFYVQDTTGEKEAWLDIHESFGLGDVGTMAAIPAMNRVLQRSDRGKAGPAGQRGEEGKGG